MDDSPKVALPTTRVLPPARMQAMEENPSQPRRFQFTLRGTLWATFWVAVAFALWSVGPAKNTNDWWSFGPVLIGISCVAMGALLGRHEEGILVGIMIAAVLFVASFLLAWHLFIQPKGLNSLDLRPVGYYLAAVGIGAGIGALFRRTLRGMFAGLVLYLCLYAIYQIQGP